MNAEPQPARTPSATASRTPVAILGAVAVGGAVGTSARAVLATAFPHPPAAFPWATLLTNLSGCALLGVIATLLATRPGTPPLARPLLTTGLCGAFTTFSTFTLDTVVLLRHGRPALGALYLAASLAGGFAALRVGIALGRLLGARRRVTLGAELAAELDPGRAEP